MYVNLQTVENVVLYDTYVDSCVVTDASPCLAVCLRTDACVCARARARACV